ncbi:caspase-8 [Odontesthes bonariensis]|uniref:caspase-8 n=1 Tax=Odontesthes bonariensis TaxID=219752 RepID=UPI003F58B5FD
MDRRTLSRVDEELDSSEVAELCFLCSDVINRKRLEGISDAKGLFLKLEEKGLLDNGSFLCQLLHIIHRADLLSLLQTDCRQQEETDANPILSKYRVMLYKIHEDMTRENLDKMKFLLTSELGRRQLELSNTALDVFAEMEKMGLMSATNVDELHRLLSELDQQLASIVQTFKQGLHTQPQHIPSGLISIDQQRANNFPPPAQPFLSISETQPSCGGESLFSDAQPDTESSSLSDETEYYSMSRIPRGLCVIINNETFFGPNLKNRQGTQEDEKTLTTVFKRFGFKVVVHKDLTADKIRHEIQRLSQRDFLRDDALVIAILSHGEVGCVFGSDENEVRLRELTEPFRSGGAPTLAGKPKLFFIQACQGNGYQIGSLPCPPMAIQEEEEKPSRLEEDAGRVQGKTVPWDADFLIGMATVSQFKSFRNTSTGSIYIQELCRQLTKSAESTEKDDILTVLTRVNREVSKGVYLSFKQMPEPKYTLTKKLVLRYV